MCGIVAVVELPPSFGGASAAVDNNPMAVCKGMVSRLRSRGPDGESIVRIGSRRSDTDDPEVVLGHTRLAIVGGATAKSPFVWRTGDGTTSMALIHNGEVYNHAELKQQLSEEGLCTDTQFRSNCDSEVLVACCALKGVEWTLSRIRGIFAFVLVEFAHDEEKEAPQHQQHDFLSCTEVRRVIVARDKFGVKPLCFAMDDKDSPRRIVFASQVSAIDPVAFAGRKIQVLEDVPPGSYQEYSFAFDNRQQHQWFYECVTHRYTSCDFDKYSLFGGLSSRNHLHSVEDIESLNLLRAQLVQAVTSRMPPRELHIGHRVKTAILLSGGLDSSLIASIASEVLDDDEELYTFNISYDNGTGGTVGTDQAYARRVRDHLSKKRTIHHQEVTFTFKDGIEVLDEVIACLETYDAVSIRAGVPLFLLSRHIKAQRFKVLLCGEGADEVFGGYRLFEAFRPESAEDFDVELCRRLASIDTSELQRLDRVTSAHGLEARVPFLDLNFVSTAMQFPPDEKMSHATLGRIQKYLLRRAFSKRKSDRTCDDSLWLPDSCLYREKEQLADGIGRSFVEDLRNSVPPAGQERSLLDAGTRLGLVKDRQQRRQHGWKAQSPSAVATGKAQPCRWYPLQEDSIFTDLALSETDVRSFLQDVLDWPPGEYDRIQSLPKPSLDLLNKLIVSMLERVPFHNLTLLVRPRRPPTPDELKADMMSGLGGPCAVVNTFFAALLVAMGFGPHVYLLSCEINGRDGCHVAVLVQMDGLRYFVDVANGKPYTEAVHLGDSSMKSSLNGSFSWSLAYDATAQRMRLLHSGRPALSFDPTETVPYRSFHTMIQRSRSDQSFGPFLTGLRFCVFGKDQGTGATTVRAVRDMNIYHGPTIQDVRTASGRQDIRLFAAQHFEYIREFYAYVDEALRMLDMEVPGWFERACAKKAQKRVIDVLNQLSFVTQGI